ncbi:MAG: hypothetical protein HY423_10935 [Candidatus Lambdaproteobacteria bacterium]|nr:hypothetical protein [Candidatus Lambdaproteobacteria bacterium]
MWCLLYPRLQGAGRPAVEGLKFGLLLSLFLGSYGVFAEAAKFEVHAVPAWLAYEGAFFLVQFALMGLITGLIHGPRRA